MILPRNPRGLTLIELMIAVALIGIGVIAAIGSFNGVHKSIQTSKGHTLATNLAQEQMQILMQKSYYEILATTAPTYNNDFNPPFVYDPYYFAPKSITEGGMNFTRYTYVQPVQEVDNAIQGEPPGTPDTGMRQITVNVEWQGPTGNSFVTLQNVINNPNTVMSNAVINGQVTDATTHLAISGATVNVAENVGWRDNTDATGRYTVHASPGVFNFVATASGYYPSYFTLSIAPNQTLSQNVALSQISSGTVVGTAWVENHVVISQVVASTVTTTDTEYIELYNPTSSPVIMGVSDPTSPLYWSSWNSLVYYYDHSSNVSYSFMTYISSYIPANSYYLIANTTTVTVGGISRRADAVYGPSAYSYVNGSSGVSFLSPGHMMQAASAGGLLLWIGGSTGGWSIADRVGWQDSAAGQSAPGTTVEPTDGTGHGISSVTGLSAGEQFVRKTDTGTVNTSFGRAYDADSNNTDFVDQGSLVYLPNNSAVQQIPVTGVPAVGANVSLDDGLSSSVQAILTGSPAYAQFSVTNVATGTWIAIVDSGTLSAEVDGVAVTSSTVTAIPNASTTPVWPVTNLNSTVITATRSIGLISGTVTDAFGSIITPAITVTAGGVTSTVGPTGRYTIRISTGTYDVIANPGNANSSYAAVTQANISLSAADGTVSVNFQLSQSGKAQGWMTRDGINPLPGVTVEALDANGIAEDTEVSSFNGSFTLINLTTGPYTIQPTLDPKETASPTSNAVTVAAGTTVSVGTFTITGAMGTLTGTVTSGGSRIQTGVLIVVSTGTIPLPPPTLNQSSLTQSPFYENSSQEDGTYTLQVRGSTTTTYTASAFYMRVSGTAVTISSKTISGITMVSGQPTSGVNFSW